jgi:hypothetical protein
VLIRGNLRTDRLKVFSSVCDKVQELFGDKYKVLMIEDPEAYLDGPSEGPSSSSRSSSSTARGSGANAAAQPEPRVAFQVCGMYWPIFFLWQSSGVLLANVLCCRLSAAVAYEQSTVAHRVGATVVWLWMTAQGADGG